MGTPTLADDIEKLVDARSSFRGGLAEAVDRLLTILRRIDPEKPENVERAAKTIAALQDTCDGGRTLCPEIDDGCKCREEAAAILRALVED